MRRPLWVIWVFVLSRFGVHALADSNIVDLSESGERVSMLPSKQLLHPKRQPTAIVQVKKEVKEGELARMLRENPPDDVTEAKRLTVEDHIDRLGITNAQIDHLREQQENAAREEGALLKRIKKRHITPTWGYAAAKVELEQALDDTAIAKGSERAWPKKWGNTQPKEERRKERRKAQMGKGFVRALIQTKKRTVPARELDADMKAAMNSIRTAQLGAQTQHNATLRLHLPPQNKTLAIKKIKIRMSRRWDARMKRAKTALLESERAARLRKQDLKRDAQEEEEMQQNRVLAAEPAPESSEVQVRKLVDAATQLPHALVEKLNELSGTRNARKRKRRARRKKQTQKASWTGLSTPKFNSPFQPGSAAARKKKALYNMGAKPN